MLGTANAIVALPTIQDPYDFTSKKHLLAGTFPKKQLAQFAGTILALTTTDGKALLVMSTRAYNALASKHMV